MASGSQAPRKAYGFSVEWLDEDALQELGLKAYGGIESASGAVVDPYRLTHDLLLFCAKRGAGIFGETKDGLPFIGRPKPEINEHYVLGFGGNGITYSVMAMDAINDSIHHTSHRFLDDYRFDR